MAFVDQQADGGVRRGKRGSVRPVYALGGRCTPASSDELEKIQTVSRCKTRVSPMLGPLFADIDDMFTYSSRTDAIDRLPSRIHCQGLREEGHSQCS